jgi:hypothetical protein
MVTRSLATLLGAALAAALFLTGCNFFPTGPGLLLEPHTEGQLIPLHVGNNWHYRDLVSGSTVQPADDPWVITNVPRYMQCFAVTEAAPEVPCNGIKMPTYTDGVHAWTVTFDGILVGAMTRGVVLASPNRDTQDIAVIRLSLPMNPVVGRTYSYDHSLTCVGIERVTVPAGTFEAYHFNQISNKRQYWWTRGVGLVQKKVFGEDERLVEHWALDSYVLKN